MCKAKRAVFISPGLFRGVEMGEDTSLLEAPEFLELVPKVREYVERKGLDWCIAALVDGSIGYYWYDTAKRLIESVLKGRNWVSERTGACFGGNSAKEALFDFRNFERLEERDPERARGIVELVKRTAGLDIIQAWTFSALYPTFVP
jgi:hypothetical protein